MKSKVIKSVIALILLIEFYPVESTSQDLPEGNKFSLNSGITVKAVKNYELSEPVISADKKVAEIKFTIFNEGKVSLDVYDQGGNMIEQLVEGDLENGEYAVYFKSQKEIKTGDYNYVLNYNGNKTCKRITTGK